ncbi:protein of unknown function [Candidatus Methylomirabilis oxygeniifera]|uniref:Uncharacterized protein n=1 Tax=Methylomirabilis oxygeniifera TaxID=671143 RepID=D5MKQ2_METO1|nr:protein of unknown function [Candidatus Methylomirabilis oxyfera]
MQESEIYTKARLEHRGTLTVVAPVAEPSRLAM